MGVVIANQNVWVDAAIEEIVEHTNDITEYPIEDGSKIHSHAHLLPRLVTVDGLIIGAGWEERLSTLITARETRMIVRYVGRVHYGSLVIKEIRDSYDAGIANGARVRIVFQQVKIVGSPAGETAEMVVDGSGGEGAVGIDPGEELDNPIPPPPPPEPETGNRTTEAVRRRLRMLTQRMQKVAARVNKIANRGRQQAIRRRNVDLRATPARRTIMAAAERHRRGN